MILMLNSGMFGVDITHMSPNNYIESCETHELVYNWKKRGYSTILDVMMVIINHDIHKLKHCTEYFIIF